MTATATPTKLRSGDWGARVTGAVSSGDTITITTKAGKSWTATVDRVVWTNGDVTIVSTRKSSHRTSRPTSRRGGKFRCEHCGTLRTRSYCPGFDCDGD